MFPLLLVDIKIDEWFFIIDAKSSFLKKLREREETFCKIYPMISIWAIVKLK